MMSIPTINMMDFGPEVQGPPCYADAGDASLHIRNFEFHYKHQQEENKIGTCAVCKKTIYFNAEQAADLYTTLSSTSKSRLIDTITAFIYPDDPLSFNTSFVCMFCYSQIDRAETLFQEFNAIKASLKEKLIVNVQAKQPEIPEPPPAHLSLEEMESIIEGSLLLEKDPKAITKKEHNKIEISVPRDIFLPKDDRKGYRCQFCFRKFKKLSSIAKHFDITHGRKAKIECRICLDNVRGNLKAFLKHVHQVHPDLKIRKVLGDFKVDDALLLRSFKKPIEKVHKMRKTTCLGCNKIMCETEILNHVRDQHPLSLRTTQCHICENDVYKSKMRYHLLDKHGIGPLLTCSQCPQQFTKFFTLKTHEERIHSNVFQSRVKKWQCPVCAKKFYRRCEVREHHRLVHENLRPLTCHICQATFKKNGTLKVHMRSHTGIKPYACGVCSKTFTRITGCKKHIRNVHKIECNTRINDALYPSNLPIEIVCDPNPIPMETKK